MKVSCRRAKTKVVDVTCKFWDGGPKGPSTLTP